MDIDINGDCAQGTHFTIQHNGENVVANWQSSTEEHLLQCDQNVLDSLYYKLSSDIHNLTLVHCCTEYNYNGVFICCHPSYKERVLGLTGSMYILLKVP